ncbi:hypothetical protein PHYPO_G00216330 [Pangasianodon hypophthalmus]|uniref:Uncharacterized protein n=1 Tax=Pangasianodon hypophthalmus TaxID=310915 RepID=A0A5N5P7Y7_PANHP|nr:hypothetical protein PHYPO_G00216330 [Pangasianodon hypophthalmus]
MAICFSGLLGRSWCSTDCSSLKAVHFEERLADFWGIHNYQRVTCLVCWFLMSLIGLCALRWYSFYFHHQGNWQNSWDTS